MCKVSVIIPCYNCGQYLNDAIESVKKQTFSDWEIIVIDDGSTDQETINILSTLPCDNRIKLIQQGNNGPAYARNTGISQAKGELILPLDADDTISPYYMEEAVPLFEKNDNLGIVYCRAQKFGKETGEWILPSYSAQNMAFDNVIFVSAFFKKSDWELVGGFPNYAYFGLEDYAFWLRLLRLGREVYKIDKILFNYRIRDISRTVLFLNDNDKVISTYASIFRDNIDFFYKNAEGIYRYRFNNQYKKYDIINIIYKISPTLYSITKRLWALYQRVR